MPVAVRNEYPGRTPVGPLVRAIRATLVYERAARCEVSVLLTDDATMRDLNHRYRRHDTTTDVLSFQQHEHRAPQPGAGCVSANGRVLGDIVISVDTAKRQARERAATLGSELAHLAAHGTLHLLGYDDATESGYAEMVEREADILIAAFGEAPA